MIRQEREPDLELADVTDDRDDDRAWIWRDADGGLTLGISFERGSEFIGVSLDKEQVAQLRVLLGEADGWS